MARHSVAKSLCSLFCLALFAVPLVGCGGVEDEPVGVPSEVESETEGVDLSLER